MIVAHKVAEKGKAFWCDLQRAILIKILLVLRTEGALYSDGGYNKEELGKIMHLFLERTGLLKTQCEISSCISSTKTEWAFYNDLTNLSGFEMNAAGTKIDADPERWREMGPEYMKYSDGLLFFEDLNTLFISKSDDESESESDDESESESYDESESESEDEIENESDDEIQSESDDEIESESDYETEKVEVVVKKVCRERKIKSDPNTVLVTSLGRMLEGFAAKIDSSTQKKRISPKKLSGPDKLAEALVMLTDFYSDTLNNKESMSLKMYWYENKIHPVMFLSFTDGERKSYVEAKVAEINQIQSNL